MDNWNVKSKRFLGMAVVSLPWLASIAVALFNGNQDVYLHLTYPTLGLWAAYMGFESWKPSNK